MAARQCRVVFFKKGTEGKELSAYWIFASDIPDQGFVAVTVVVFGDDDEAPAHTPLAIKGADVDAALKEALDLVAERHPGEDWSKLSNCV